MEPREFLSHYEFDERMVTGRYFSADPVPVEPGENVGVVLLNLGGPERIEDIQPFLYNLFMDPAIIDIPLPGLLRHWLCRFIAWRRSGDKKEEYEAIGGGSPINRLTRDQAANLEDRLNSLIQPEEEISFHTYLAMRYAKPLSEDAARKMQEDDIDRVVLLPMYPQYSKTTTGSSLVYWNTLEETGEIPSWPTSYVREYATHPRYLDALSARIDEGLEAFPEPVRDDVHLLFSAHGTPLKEMTERRDPYCCLIHSTVDRLMRREERNQPFHTAFQSKVGPGRWLEPSTLEKLEELAEEGVESVLVVPVAFVTDHIETSFELDIEAREEAEEAGIEHFHVTEGLNSHEGFIDALADVTLRQVDLPEEVIEEEPAAVGRDGSDRNVSLPDLPRHDPEEREIRCIQCDHVAESICWTPEHHRTENA